MDEYYRADDQGEWTVREMADGTVLYGYESWMDTYQANSQYTFDAGMDVIRRSTQKAVDAAYSHVYCTGKNASGNELTPVYLPVPTYTPWRLPVHKTKHMSAEMPMIQSQLKAWARQQAEALQFVGITETFVSPFRPQLLPGDVAQVTNGNYAAVLGIITSVTQSFSRSDGFSTQFTVDSGGVTTDGTNTVYTRSAKLHGENRSQTLADLIQQITSGGNE